MASSDSLLKAGLEDVGVETILSFAQIGAESGFYGIYIVVICGATYSLMRKEWRKTRTVVLMVSLWMMFAVSTFLWAATIAEAVISTRGYLIDDFQGTLDERIDYVNQSVNTLLYLKAFGFNMNFFIGDALITWRVVALYRWSRWVKVVLIFLWLASLAMLGFGYTICVGLSHFAVQPPSLCLDLDAGCWVISLVLNAIATVLMARIAWARRKESKALFDSEDSGKTKTRADRILYILVVSGVVYCIIGLFGLTGFALSSPSDQIYIGVNSLISIGDQLIGLYPTAVLVFVLNEESIFGPGLSSPSIAAGDTTQSIRFPQLQGHALSLTDPFSRDRTRSLTLVGGDRNAASGPLHFSPLGTLDSGWVRDFEPGSRDSSGSQFAAM